MTVPDYQTFMLFVLACLAGSDSLRPIQIAAYAADALNVSEADRTALLPSGRITVLRSRVGWALSYLKQAGLVETATRGVYTVTQRGRDVLSRGLHRIDNDVLSEFEEFRAFRERSGSAEISPSAGIQGNDDAAESSPEEALERAYSILRASLVSQLIDALKKVSPRRFEVIVVDVLQVLGYGGGRAGAARAVGRSGDGGIDGVIEEDRLGLDNVYVQPKRWEGTVGRPTVQAFAGALQGQKANKGVMITTSDFSADARAYAANLATRIVLINGQRLAELMVDHDVGVSPEAVYTTKRVDGDYFEE
jgi:restriction system protein